MKSFRLYPLFLFLFWSALIGHTLTYAASTLAQAPPASTNTPTSPQTPTSTQTATITPTSTQTATITPTSTQTAITTPTLTQPATAPTPTATPIPTEGGNRAMILAVGVLGFVLVALGLGGLGLLWFWRRKRKPKPRRTPPPPPPTRAKLPFLRLVNSPDKVFAVNAPNFTIGRDPQSKLPLADETVADLHATIVVQNGVYVIRAENESGLKVNGLPTVKNKLQDKSRITLGRVELEFYFSDSQGRPA